MNEFDIIHRFFDRPGSDENIMLGIGDDAAIVHVPQGQELAMAMDTLIHGVHFPESTAADDIGWKALAVNLSDLAAMGAEPCWATLSLTLPVADESWLQAFAEGFFELADKYRVSLIGGDLCRGPLTVTVQAHGLVPAGQAITRHGAIPGDLIYVTGHLGDAGYALAPAAAGSSDYDYFRERLDRPQPRVRTGVALRGIASSAIDLSDGLAGDIRHIMKASYCGAVIEAGRLPLSEPLRSAVDEETGRRLALTSGDDYQLCFTVSANQARTLESRMASIGETVKQVGEITASSDLIFRVPDGEQDYSAYLHFG